ncbi:MAG: alpha/beta hydrolase [Clostridia bacterium]|nr:alpha/beta hydrolase [Clostridia bacterium]
MTKSEILFKSIDYILHFPQNYKQYPEVSIEKDIVYDENYPYIAKGDAYYDKKFEKDGKYPVILNIHGGGYVAGDKRHRKSLCSRFADQGWFVYNINYRLSPQYPFPSAVIDCMNALNFLKTLAEKYDIDLDRVVVTGDSSGGYLASYLVAASTKEDLREQLGIPAPVVSIAGLASFSGPYDVMVALRTQLPFGLIRDIGDCFLGMKLKKDFSNLEEYPYINEIGVISHVNSDWCPTFLSYAEQDILCKGQGELLEQKLKEAGVPVWSHKSTKALDNHCYHLDMYKSVSKECFAEAGKFLEVIKSK